MLQFNKMFWLFLQLILLLFFILLALVIIIKIIGYYLQTYQTGVRAANKWSNTGK